MNVETIIIIYLCGAALTTIVVFCFTLLACIEEKGIFWGAGLGWVPAGICGGVAGLLWPFIAVALAYKYISEGA